MTPSAPRMRDRRVITVEDWAEIRRLYLAERMLMALFETPQSYLV